MDIRHYVVSLAAVFLALATGIALAAGPLSDAPAPPGPAGQGQQRLAQLREQVSLLRGVERYEAAFGSAVVAGLIQGQLSGRSVTVAALPGAADSLVDAARDTLTVAGAEVQPTVRLTDRLVDPGERQLLEELLDQLVAALPGISVPADAPTYDRVGALLARALVTTRDSGDRLDRSAANILAALQTARLVSPDGELESRAGLVLVVAGPKVGQDEATRAGHSIVQALVRALDAGSDGVLVAGPPQSGLDGGVVAAVRTDPPTAQAVSTLDVLNRPSGRASAVLALAEQAAGGGGHYGIRGSTAAPPVEPAG